MAKESGIAATLTIDDSGGTGRAITNDVVSLSVDMSRGNIEISGLDAAGTERLLLRGDATFTVNGIFNDASNMSFDVLKTICSASVIRTVTWVISGQTLEVECALVSANYNLAEDGSLKWTATFQAAESTTPTWA